MSEKKEAAPEFGETKGAATSKDKSCFNDSTATDIGQVVSSLVLAVQPEIKNLNWPMSTGLTAYRICRALRRIFTEWSTPPLIGRAADVLEDSVFVFSVMHDFPFEELLIEVQLMWRHADTDDTENILAVIAELENSADEAWGGQ